MSMRIHIITAGALLLPFSSIAVSGSTSCGGSGSSGPVGGGASGKVDASPVVGSGGGMLDAGKDGDAGDVEELPPSAMPIWVPLPEKIVDCPVERMANPDAVRAFSWKPCSEGTGCEQMTYEPWFSSNPDALKEFRLYTVALHTVATDAYAILGILSPDWSVVLVLHEDGRVLDGYRVSQLDGCLSRGGSMWGNRYGLVFRHEISAFVQRVGGILHSMDSTAPPTAFEATTAPSGCGPATQLMGETRWLWNCSCNYVTLATAGPLDLQTIDTCLDPIIAISYLPTVTGPTFLFGEWRTPDGMNLESRIMFSDGVAPPQPYLVASDGSFYDDPSFAHSHVAWIRAIGFQGPGAFDAIEIWASPYSDNPSLLVPYKVGDYGLKSPPSYHRASGFGRLAVMTGADAPTYGEAVIWDLATKTTKTVALPGKRKISAFMGMTPTHLWLAGIPPGMMATDAMYRFQVGQ